jgi:hypothetical protein
VVSTQILPEKTTVKLLVTGKIRIAKLTNMKRVFLLFLVSIIITNTECQVATDTIKLQRSTYGNFEELLLKKKIAGIDTLYYVDSLLNYKVVVPAWLTLHETSSRFIWGGTLPSINGIEDAITIKGFSKEKYTDLASFQRYVIGDWVFGEHPNWSSTRVCYGRKDLGKFKDFGKIFIVYIFSNSKIYSCKYALLETKTAFLWVDFTSTPNTFDSSVSKFDSFLNAIELTKY